MRCKWRMVESTLSGSLPPQRVLFVERLTASTCKTFRVALCIRNHFPEHINAWLLRWMHFFEFSIKSREWSFPNKKIDKLADLCIGWVSESFYKKGKSQPVVVPLGGWICAGRINGSGFGESWKDHSDDDDELVSQTATSSQCISPQRLSVNNFRLYSKYFISSLDSGLIETSHLSQIICNEFLMGKWNM